MKNKKNNKKIGTLGENLACKFLKRREFIITDRNYWQKWGEIDIIAKKEEVIHFVEVKSVSRESFKGKFEERGEYRPEENVHPQKIKRFMRTIETYLEYKNLTEEEWVFDVIAVFIDTKNKISKVRIIENVII